MIDILRQKTFFPLKNFDDVEKLFRFNIDSNNGEPNLALLSIVAGLIEHSLVIITDKEDLIANSRPVEHRKDLFQNKSNSGATKNKKASTSTSLPSTSTSQQQHQNHLSSSTSTDPSRSPKLKSTCEVSCEFNEAAYVSSADSKNKERNQAETIVNEANGSDHDEEELSALDNLSIPEIEYEIVETLYKRFVDQLKASVDLKDIEANKVNLKIKKISDSVWAHLSNSYYKDKAHLQSIFSYLTTSKLDCFGLAFAVIAGCQSLNLKNIYLALSEDHAWVMFDDDQDREKQKNAYVEKNLPIPSCALHGTCEVTWHGKANSDKRGQPVTYKNCWLYTNGYAVKCDFRKCVLALVNSINPTINTNTDSEILALLQQRLLWLLYKKKYYFPMALGNLGELENLSPTPGAPLQPIELFHLGIEISRNEYNDSHVYPYTYLASFFFRHGRFKESLETWADASAVMTKYNYSRDDEEIYKEFFEVANELIPSMLKVLTAGGLEPGRVSKKPFLQDAECLALILKFYDNICVWEEGSSTPVLHIGWAKNFVATVLKFSQFIRSRIKLLTEEEWLDKKNNDSKTDLKPGTCVNSESDVVSSRTDNSDSSKQQNHLSSTSIDSTDRVENTACQNQRTPSKRKDHDVHDHSHNQAEQDNDTKDRLHNETKIDNLGKQSSSKKRLSAGTTDTDGNDNSCLNKSSPAKKPKIANPGCGHETVTCVETSSSSIKSSASKPSDQATKSSAGHSDEHLMKRAMDQNAISKTKSSDNKPKQQADSAQTSQRCIEVRGDNVTIILKSSKIAGLRELLHADRLNKTAIELQLTAQSQCAVRGRSNSSSYSSDFIPSSAIGSILGGTTRSKRSHR